MTVKSATTNSTPKPEPDDDDDEDNEGISASSVAMVVETFVVAEVLLTVGLVEFFPNTV